jgi:chromate reductase
MAVKILAFDGSGRKESFNRNVLEHVITQAKSHGAEVTQINVHDLDLPLYNGDLEAEGIPEAVMKLKEVFKAHDALLIASPEYNGGYSALLKNTIDWVSRPVKGEAPLNCFTGKVAGLIATSPGKLGGLRAIYQLNTVLFGIGVLVLPNIVSVGFYKDAIDENSSLKNEPDQKAVAALAKRLVEVTTAIQAQAK